MGDIFVRQYILVLTVVISDMSRSSHFVAIHKFGDDNFVILNYTMDFLVYVYNA